MKRTHERRQLRGTLRWRDGEQVDVNVYLDRLAVYKDRLLLLSCVGYSGEIKALRAALATGLRSYMDFRDMSGKPLMVKRGLEQVTLDRVQPPDDTRFRSEAYRLGYQVLHAIFVAQTPGLILEDSDEALWQELKDARFTTPLLPGWLPYIRRELVQANLLQPLACLDCSCLGLSAKTEDLDRIVEHGLKNKIIHIRKEDAA